MKTLIAAATALCLSAAVGDAWQTWGDHAELYAFGLEVGHGVVQEEVPYMDYEYRGHYSQFHGFIGWAAMNCPNSAYSELRSFGMGVRDGLNNAGFSDQWPTYELGMATARNDSDSCALLDETFRYDWEAY